MNYKTALILVAFKLFFIPFVSAKEKNTYQTPILVVGGGASGVTAGLQASRLGVKTLIIEETDWLGGMLTSAGVSAVDGNHQLPSGLWGEFRQKINDYYGGRSKVETGWHKESWKTFTISSNHEESGPVIVMMMMIMMFP